MSAFFAEYARVIVFIHVLFAVTWIGGMVAIRFAMHPALSVIEDGQKRVELTIATLNRFFLMVSTAIVFIGITGIIMMLGIGFKAVPTLYMVVHIKSQIWMVMAVVYGVIYFKFTKAKKLFLSGDLETTRKTLAPLAKWLIPTNIFLGLIEIMLGIVLRGY
ncbi:MAG: hypothetical protein JHC37_06260 [Campylobacteraceae bacterium]|jgi:uncharacterized membrane protein|nr:hypothetical protein [Campylobacteraceae bacterium]